MARVYVNGRRVRTIRGSRLLRTVTLKLKAGRKAHVVVTSKTKTGEARRNGRRYKACQA